MTSAKIPEFVSFSMLVVLGIPSFILEILFVSADDVWAAEAVVWKVWIVLEGNVWGTEVVVSTEDINDIPAYS